VARRRRGDARNFDGGLALATARALREAADRFDLLAKEELGE
jgi:hypothetical protein